MPGPRPELLFISGPQKGQRAVLMRDVMIGGRGDLADLSFTEEFISREQLQFQHIAEGWIVERMAQSNPMRINGKRYKPGKQILLASGDVIAIGVETEILFVDSMDDPNHVLAEYRMEHPEAEPTPVEPPSPAMESAPVASPPPAEPADVTSEPQPNQPAKKKTVAKSSPKTSKARKYLIAILAYLAILGVGVILLSQLKKDDTKPDESAPPRLKAEDISKILHSDLERSPNEVSAQRSLKEARLYYRLRSSERRNLYHCVLMYRLYKAYRRPDERVFLPEDERKYVIATRELSDKVWSMYSDAAFKYEGSGQWAKAKEQYELLMDYIPLSLADDDPAVRDDLLNNVMAHINYVSKHRGKK